MLGWCSKRLRDDKEVVLAAVSRTGIALRFASERLRHDFEVCRAACRQNGAALEFVGKRVFMGGLADYDPKNLSIAVRKTFSDGPGAMQVSQLTSADDFEAGEYPFTFDMDGLLVEEALKNEPLAIRYVNPDAIVWPQVRLTVMQKGEKEMDEAMYKIARDKVDANFPWKWASMGLALEEQDDSRNAIDKRLYEPGNAFNYPGRVC
jgi:hypothetical protein